MHGNTNGNANHATGSQLWRLNTMGCLAIRERPADPIDRNVAKELLAALAAEGLWQPQARAGKR